MTKTDKSTMVTTCPTCGYKYIPCLVPEHDCMIEGKKIRAKALPLFDRMAGAVLEVAQSYNPKPGNMETIRQAVIIAESLVDIGKLIDAAIDRDVILSEIEEVV